MNLSMTVDARLVADLTSKITALEAELAALKAQPVATPYATECNRCGGGTMYRPKMGGYDIWCPSCTPALNAAPAQPVQPANLTAAPVQPAPLSDRHTAELKALSMLLRNMEGPVTLSAKKIAIADAIDAAVAHPQFVQCRYGDGGYACCEGRSCEADEHNDAIAKGQSAPLTDADILTLNANEVFFSESPSKYPEAGHGTQYHAGAPGVIAFARAVWNLRTGGAA